MLTLCPNSTDRVVAAEPMQIFPISPSASFSFAVKPAVGPAAVVSCAPASASLSILPALSSASISSWASIRSVNHLASFHQGGNLYRQIAAQHPRLGLKF